jgi:hypothetical protein
MNFQFIVISDDAFFFFFFFCGYSVGACDNSSVGHGFVPSGADKIFMQLLFVFRDRVNSQYFTT